MFMTSDRTRRQRQLHGSSAILIAFAVAMLVLAIADRVSTAGNKHH